MTATLALLPIIAFAIGLLTSLATFYLWLSNSVRKKYAAEREFEHIQRNQEGLKTLILELSDDIDGLKVEIVRFMSNQK